MDLPLKVLVTEENIRGGCFHFTRHCAIWEKPKTLWAHIGPWMQALNHLKLCFFKLESQGEGVVPLTRTL